jgi:[calcium/calmodulin-dependent protein kinase] kinase
MGCCSCFGFLRKPSVPARQPREADGILSEDLLKRQSAEDPDGSFYTGDDPDASFCNGDYLDQSFYNGDDPDRSFSDRDDAEYLDGSDDGPPRKTAEDIIQSRVQSGFACREIPVKETKKVFRSEVTFFNAYFFLSSYVCTCSCISIFEAMSIAIPPNLAHCMHELFLRTCFFHIKQLASPINLDILYHYVFLHFHI